MATSTIGLPRRSGRARHFRLAIAPVAMALADLALTLLGQTDEYWGGDYSTVLEANPLARLLLETHPAALPGSFIPYLALMALLILRSRPAAGRAWSLVFTLCHTFGASTWLLRMPGGIVYCLAVWLAARWLVGLGDACNST